MAALGVGINIQIFIYCVCININVTVMCNKTIANRRKTEQTHTLLKFVCCNRVICVNKTYKNQKKCYSTLLPVTNLINLFTDVSCYFLS
jgi:hypothetical protein